MQSEQEIQNLKFALEATKFQLKEAYGELANANATITNLENEIATLFSEKEMKDFLNWSKDAVYNNADELLSCWKQNFKNV